MEKEGERETEIWCGVLCMLCVLVRVSMHFVCGVILCVLLVSVCCVCCLPCECVGFLCLCAGVCGRGQCRPLVAVAVD